MDSSERDTLIKECQPIVRAIAGRIAKRVPRSIEFDDLIQEGNIGLMQAISTFDEKKDTEITTYVRYRIHGAMIDYLRGLDILPRSKREQKKLVEKTIDELTSELGQEPTYEQIRKKLDIPYEKFYELMEELWLEPPQPHERLHLFLVSPEPSPLDLMEDMEKREILLKTISTLSPDHQYVVYHYFFKNMNQDEIAKKLKVSPSRICQILKVALRRLKTKLTYKYAISEKSFLRDK